MSKQTDKSRYPSRYSPNKYVTEAQFIIELICEKKAKLDKKELGVYFWRQDEWKTFFSRWLRQVHKLLKSYSGKAIIAALKDKRSGLRYSLHSEYMMNLINEHQKRLDKIKIHNTFDDVKEPETIRVHKPNNTLSRLMDLDGEEQ